MWSWSSYLFSLTFSFLNSKVEMLEPLGLNYIKNMNHWVQCVMRYKSLCESYLCHCHQNPVRLLISLRTKAEVLFCFADSKIIWLCGSLPYYFAPGILDFSITQNTQSTLQAWCLWHCCSHWNVLFSNICEAYLIILFCLNAISLERPLTTQCKRSILLSLYPFTLTYWTILISHHFDIHMCLFTGLWFFLLLKFKLRRNRDCFFSYCSL